MAKASVTQPMSGAKWRRMVRDQWSDAAGAWERWEASVLQFTSGVDPVLLRALDLEPGQRTLDFGCGTGEPALQIARWIGPRGSVLGLDVAGPMLDVARRRARLLGIRNARFRRGDVTRLSDREAFDRVSSRFGLMFADDVPGALARVRTALRPGGRVAFAVWGPPALNPSFTIANDAVGAFTTTPPPDPETSPHPMRLARPGLLPRLLREAGFRAIRVAEAPVYAAYPDADTYVRRVLEVAAAIRAVYDTLSPANQRRVRERLRRGAARHRSGEAVRIPGMAWVVSGRR
jgi:ubiquinone/menaquinone biosynthesis C-methylase UbiE